MKFNNCMLHVCIYIFSELTLLYISVKKIRINFDKIKSFLSKKLNLSIFNTKGKINALLVDVIRFLKALVKP